MPRDLPMPLSRDITMSEVKRPRGRPVTRILPMPGTTEYTEGCPGCRGDGFHHNVQCKRRTSEAAASASHVGGASQTASQAASRAANSSQVGGAIQNVSGSKVATSQVGSASSNQVEAHAGVQAAVHVELRITQHGCERFTWELQVKKHSSKQLIKTWSMPRQTMTLLTWQSWNTHILTKMANTLNGNILSRDTSMKTTERLWILYKSKQVSNARWRSWGNSVLVSRATARDGVTSGKVTQRAVGLWCDRSEKEQIPVYTRVHQDQLQRGSC